MHIGIVFWGLFVNRGGVQKFCADLVAAMVERGHQVTAFYKHNKNALAAPLYPLPSTVPLLNLRLDGYARSPALRKSSIAKARECIATSGVDVLVAPFSWSELMFFPALLQGTGIPFLVSEHSHPERINSERWNRLEHEACLSAADSIHVLSERFLPLYPDFLRARITPIPNTAALDIPHTPRLHTPNASIKRLLAAGRFIDDIKQYSLLIRAFAGVAAKFPDWRLTLCGDGPDKKSYQKLIAELGLEQRVSLPGMVDDMAAYYQKSELFCMPSRYEGFGLAALEAQHYGLPVVGFAECTGVNEIIVHGENGLLAESMTVEALAESLAVLMADADVRSRMAARGMELLARYSRERVFDAWERLLADTARVRGDTRLSGLALEAPAEERCAHDLREILSRKTPFDRPGDDVTRRLEQRVRFLEDWRNAVRGKWYYRAWLWISRLLQ